MLFLFKSTPENKKRKHSEHFLHHQEPLGSQRADRTYCTWKYMFNIWDESCRNSPRWWLPYIQISSVVRSRVDGSEKNWKDWKRNEEVEALLGNNDRPVIFLQTGESLLRGEPIRWVGCTGKARPTYTGGKLRASADMAIHPRLHTVHTSWHKWRLVEIESSTLDEEILDRLQSLLTDGFQWLEKTLEKANRSLPNNTG